MNMKDVAGLGIEVHWVQPMRISVLLDPLKQVGNL
jgi:hypothetical protein